MSVPENNPEIGSPTDLEARCRELSRLVNVLFAGLIVSSFTLTAFLGLQMKRSHEEAAQAKAQAEELRQTAQQEDAAIQATFARLADFARRHPDFQNQVLSKYKVTSAPAK